MNIFTFYIIIKKQFNFYNIFLKSILIGLIHILFSCQTVEKKIKIKICPYEDAQKQIIKELKVNNEKNSKKNTYN